MDRIPVFQAPIKVSPTINPIKTPLTYPHILHNSGYDHAHSLLGMVKGWRALFKAIKPDLVIFDHSPTAILAARGYSFRKLIIGTGFTIPPDIYPMSNLRFWIDYDPEALRLEENRVLENVNNILEKLGLATLDRIADLFSELPKVFRTLKKLDPYNHVRREQSNYFGGWVTSAGEVPKWPEGTGKKVFAYLKPFSKLPTLISRLKETQTPAIIYVDKIAHELEKKFSCSTIHFASDPQDLRLIFKQCDFAILNATLNSCIVFLLAGIFR